MCIFHALVMHCTQPPLAYTFATLVMLWSIPYFFILACHVYFMLCSILLCLLFELHFSLILHSSCIILLVHTLISCPRFSLALCLFVSKRGRVYSRVVYQRVLSFLYDSCARSQGEKFYFSCTFVGGVMFHKGDAYTKGEKTLMLIRKLCFVCFSLCLFSCFLYSALGYVQYLYFVVLIASCLCVGHLYIFMLLCFIECMFG